MIKYVYHNYKRTFLALIAAAFCIQAFGQVDVTPSIDEIRKPFGPNDAEMFKSPPKINYPQTWFHFIGGNVSKEGITEDLEAIAGAGFSGVQFFHGQAGGPWPGVEPQITSLSPSWDETVKHLAEECKRLGLRFTMQNCPGWATSGGPWITPQNAMRHLVWSRTDVTPSNSGVALPKPQPSDEPWRDYTDVAVLAFPTPLGDTGGPLIPKSVNSNRELPWMELLSGTNRGGSWTPESAPGDPIRIEVAFAEPVTVRTLEMPSINQVNHHRNYEPGITVALDAVGADGTLERVMHCVIPPANSQDNRPVSLACSGEALSDKYVLTIENKYPMMIGSLKMFSAARKNSWESEAAWTLRNLERENTDPSQNPDAYVRSDAITDITEFMDSDGNLDWKAPDGKWTVLRIGHVNTGRRNSPAPPEGTGWECNKLSPSGPEAQFAGYIGRINQGPLAGGLLNGMLLDSWECETQTWTAGMESEFAKMNDYDVRKWLPAVMGYVVDDQETTAKFLRDWRGTISNLFSNNFYGTMAKLAKENGLSITYETAAGDVFPADILEYYKYADVPMCEFWQPFTEGFVGSLNFKPIKPTASAARFYGKPRVAAESFTSFSHTWDEHWSTMKEVANHNLAEGVTHLVYHTYTHNPQKPFLPPGTSFGGAGIGTPFMRGQTWWKHMPELNDYFARCSYMMERGRPVSDIIWYLGDEMSAKPDQDPNYLQGFKYDYCNPDILLTRLSVDNGRLVTPDGIEYRVLWMPDNYRMLPETLEKILSLVKEGATVIGDAPKEIATLNGGAAARKRFDRAVGKIWGKASGANVKKIGKGRVISGMPIQEALAAAGVTKDVTGDVLWLHRRTEGADWYFVAPQRGRSFSGNLTFRSSGQVEIWDPVTGNRVAAEGQATDDGRTTVALDIPECGACYVVFRRDAGAVQNTLPAEPKHSLTILPDDNWTLSFPEGWGAPERITLDRLIAWKDLDIPAEGKAFSGTATYENTFTIDDCSDTDTFILDLGRVEMIASVTVNGIPVRTLWAPPYRTDITEFVKQGKNLIEIEVTSTWFNRLVYDAGRLETERKTWVQRWPDRNAPLRESGLVEGPVYITVLSSLE